jgi:hypothetical protein
VILINQKFKNMNTSTRNKIIILIIIALALCAGLYCYMQSNGTVSDYKNATYSIEGTAIKLNNGYAETEVVEGSAAKLVTRYFGNELQTDLDSDGDDDLVFLLTQESGGSGMFYYAVAALKTEQGYVGSDGYFLGDRIAPQSIDVSQNPRHKNVIVVNVAERAVGAPMTDSPSVGKSIYLKLHPVSMQWGIVEPDFEGEAR